MVAADVFWRHAVMWETEHRANYSLQITVTEPVELTEN